MSEQPKSKAAQRFDDYFNTDALQMAKSEAPGSALETARQQAEPYAVEWQGTRRDTCYAIGEKMLELNTQQAAAAWASLGRHLVRLGDRDIPKFMDMITGVNAATMIGGISAQKSPLLLLAGEWRAEAKRRREDAEDTNQMGNANTDAQIGYAECLEDKAAVIERLAQNKPL